MSWASKQPWLPWRTPFFGPARKPAARLDSQTDDLCHPGKVNFVNQRRWAGGMRPRPGSLSRGNTRQQHGARGDSPAHSAGLHYVRCHMWTLGCIAPATPLCPMLPAAFNGPGRVGRIRVQRLEFVSCALCSSSLCLDPRSNLPSSFRW